MKKVIKTDKAAAAIGPYSQGIRVGDFIFTAGQGPRDPKTSQRTGDTIEEQSKWCLENIKGVLEAEGASMEDVVKVTVLLSDVSNFKGMNEVFKTYFPEDKAPPARVTTGVSLVLAGGLVEMDCIAYVGK